jgi:hypothetical protein
LYCRKISLREEGDEKFADELFFFAGLGMVEEGREREPSYSPHSYSSASPLPF